MLYGKKVILRSQELLDLDEMVKCWNDLEFQMTTGRIEPMTKDQLETRIRKSWELRHNGTDYIFSVDNFEGKFVGTVGLHLTSKIHRSAELGVMIINPENRNKGYGTDAVITACGYGFRHLNLHSIFLRHFPFNENGRKAYEKAGFIEVGRERDAMFRDGKYHDLLRMDILDDEWFSKFKEYTLNKP
jgi:RimJ/RimL family protein N-acetyltransferase